MTASTRVSRAESKDDVESASSNNKEEVDVEHEHHHEKSEDISHLATGYNDLPIRSSTPTKTNALQRVITGRSATSYADPGPPPDGGLRAWSIALAGGCVIFNTWGYIQTFGVFQTYYVTALSETSSTISWIGSIQIFLLFSLGPITGRATDAGYFRPIFVFGLFMQLLGIFMTSLARTYWQVILAQGVCQGIGNGCQFVPTMSLVSTYFDKKRSFAISLTAVGAAFGGLVMPAMVQQLLPKIGFGWTMRALGLIIAVLGTVAAILLKSRIPPRKAGALIEWAALKEPSFAFFCIAMFLNFWGVYFPFFYIGIYARTLLNMPYSTSISLLLVMNGVSVFGRLIPGLVADVPAIGPVKTMMFASFTSGIITLCWAAVHNITGLWAFGAFFGFFCAGIQSLFPACLAFLTPDLQKRGARMGMGFAVAGVASLTGSPIGGALVAAHGGNYLYAQMWAGSSLLAAALLLFASLMAARAVRKASLVDG